MVQPTDERCTCCAVAIKERERAENAEARLAVLDGSACAEGRSEGRDGCGLCGWCVKWQAERADKAEALARQRLHQGIEILATIGKILGQRTPTVGLCEGVTQAAERVVRERDEARSALARELGRGDGL